MKRRRHTYKQIIWTAIILAALAVLLVWTIVPIYIVVSNSFRKTLEIKQMPPKLFFEPIFSHYQKLLSFDRFEVYFRNSTIISIGSTALTVFLGSLAAYGLKICKSKLGRRISNVLLLGKMVPAITILMPLFVMMNRANLTGTYLAPIITLSCMSLPFVTWLMTGFIADIPNELIEAAGMEGCSRVSIFTRIIMPLLKPALASAIILVVKSSWNELLFSLQLTNLNTYPLTVGIARYVGSVSVDWGKCSAAATITMVPIIIIGFFMQKYLVSGMTAGAVKG